MALSGNLSETSFTDLIQFYSISRQTAKVTIVSPAGPEHDGVLFVESGDVVDAHFGELHGVEAVRRALRLKEGEFRVELNVRAGNRTVFEPWSKLVLEELVSEDEALGAEIASADIEDEVEMIAPQRNGGVKTAPTPHNLPKTLPPPPQPPRRRWALIAGVTAGVVAAAFAVLIFVQRAREKAALEEQAAIVAAGKAEAARIAAAKPRVQGVSDGEILFGMSAPFSGPAKELGRAMKTGIDIAFAAANDAGGVNGRKLRLVALDDGYEPERTKAVMKLLADDRKVFGFIGNVGTPTAEVSVPFSLERKMIFFGPFTGAGLLRRDPPDRYVFNYRASYAEETAAIFKYLVEVKRISPEEIAVFAQQDGYGDAGFNGVAKMLRKYNRDPAKALRVGYKRNTSDVQDAVDTVLKSRPRVKAVVMVPTYKAAAKFIDKVKAERSDVIFASVSFVGSQALADELMAYGPKTAAGVIVTQVVPLPTSQSTAVLKYQELLPKYSVGEKPDFVSLEGYVTAQLMIEALRRAGRDLDTEKLVNALEGVRNLDLGIGAPMSYAMSEHQASHKVWGTVLDESGAFQPLELE